MSAHVFYPFSYTCQNGKGGGSGGKVPHFVWIGLRVVELFGGTPLISSISLAVAASDVARSVQVSQTAFWLTEISRLARMTDDLRPRSGASE